MKRAVDVYQFVKEEHSKFDKLKTPIAISHNRAASVNSIDKDLDSEAHPFLSEDKSFALIHNGTMYEHRYIRRYFKLMGHKIQSGTDTEIFVHVLEDMIKTSKTRLEAMKKLHGMSSGNIIILFKDGELWGIPGSSFNVVSATGGYYIASELDSITKFLEKVKDNSEKVYHYALERESEGLLQFNYKTKKYLLYGKWNKKLLKDGEFYIKKITRCDFCDIESVPCEEIIVRGVHRDRCKTCFTSNNTKLSPRYNRSTSTTPPIPRTSTVTRHVCGYDDPYTFAGYMPTQTEKKKNRKSVSILKGDDAVGICYECGVTHPSENTVICTICGVAFCEQCVENHVCANTDGNKSKLKSLREVVVS